MEVMQDSGQSAERMEVTLHYFQPASLHKTNMVEPVNIQRVIL